MTVNQTKLSVKVHPSTHKSEVVGFTGGVLEVRVAAPPVQNKANRELIELLTTALGLARSSLTILRGDTSRHKLILIDGLTLDEVRKRLSSFSSGTASRQ